MRQVSITLSTRTVDGQISLVLGSTEVKIYTGGSPGYKRSLSDFDLGMHVPMITTATRRTMISFYPATNTDPNIHLELILLTQVNDHL